MDSYETHQSGSKTFSPPLHHWERSRPRLPNSPRRLIWLALFALLLGAAAWAKSVPATAQPAAPAAPILGFERLDAGRGWLWRGGDLFWTADAGATWTRITPAGPADARLAAVHFGGADAGWALLPTVAGDAFLATTHDAGATWRLQPLPADMAGTLTAAKTIYLQALDAEHGFLSVDLAQSSNFSVGRLWYTADGGATWQPRTLPLGEPAQFIDAAHGWLAGGPRGDALWRTQDGGATWQPQPLPYTPAAGEHVQVYPPIFTKDGEDAVLSLLLRTSAGQAAAWAASTDGGATWALVADAAAAPASLAAYDARAWLLAATGKPVLPPVLPLPFFANTAVDDGLRLAQVKLATAQTGWALAAAPAPGAGRASALLATADGGQTWQPLTLPSASVQPDAGAALAAAVALPPLDTGSHTAIGQGPGFDTCDLPTLAELAAWRAGSPYRIVNLYLGGSLRFCDNERLTAANIAALSAQGWTFIPTWVGPQAPCSNYSRRFSSSPAAAYAEGAAEAAAALAAAQALGLSAADGSGTILYYDMESFDADETCIGAVQAFVGGWTERLHAAGSLSGLYGSACNPRLDRFAGIGAPPDAIWAAQWNRSAYDPDMTVWGVACLDDSLWARSQRIRQYTGGHDETWGGVTLNIDSDVVAGPVADPSRDLAPTPTPTSTPAPTPQPVVLIATPDLQPPYGGGMCDSGWQRITDGGGQPAWLAANRAANGTIPPAATPPAAQWNPEVPSSGAYQVEAFIPAHAAIAWQCPPATLPSDTATARYTVQHADGEQVTVANQAAARGGWLPLGIYPFQVGLPAQITLSTATGEAANTRTVAAAALRLTRQAGTAKAQFLYLPNIRVR